MSAFDPKRTLDRFLVDGRPKLGARFVASRSSHDAHLVQLVARVTGGLDLLQDLLEVVARRIEYGGAVPADGRLYRPNSQGRASG